MTAGSVTANAMPSTRSTTDSLTGSCSSSTRPLPPSSGSHRSQNQYVRPPAATTHQARPIDQVARVSASAPMPCTTAAQRRGSASGSSSRRTPVPRGSAYTTGGSAVPRAASRSRSSLPNPTAAASVATRTGSPTHTTTSPAASESPATSTRNDAIATGSDERRYHVSSPRPRSTEPRSATGAGAPPGTTDTGSPGGLGGSSSGRARGAVWGGIVVMSRSSRGGPRRHDPAGRPPQGRASPTPADPRRDPRSSTRPTHPGRPTVRTRRDPSHLARAPDRTSA